MDPSTSEKLKEAQKRYKNAKRRALYWSGNPSFSPRRPQGNSLQMGTMDLNYELAMCDCRNWEHTIASITGRPLPKYDPRQRFIDQWTKAMTKRKPNQPRHHG